MRSRSWPPGYVRSPSAKAQARSAASARPLRPTKRRSPSPAGRGEHGEAAGSPLPGGGELERVADAGVEVDALRALARELASATGAVLLYDEMATLELGGETLAADVLELALVTDNYGR